MNKGYLVLEDGKIFSGEWLAGEDKAGEVIFNTSHNGYEEIATDPSYYGQIMVMCAPMQGNYGVDNSFWESKNIWIQGFIALDIDKNMNTWVKRLGEHNIPVLNDIDTRELVLYLRDKGTLTGALVQANSEDEAKKRAGVLIDAHHKLDKDWVYAVSSKVPQFLSGAASSGPRIAVIDYGCKQNILRELLRRCREVALFPSRSTEKEILDWNPDGILLSNGPGDPAEVQKSVDTIKNLLGKKVMFGICMGSQLMGRALGAETFRLKFGHHGANHPIKDLRSGKVYVTSQNHGYAIDMSKLPGSVNVIHKNLNDNTVAGIECREQHCFSVQFHPESYPGPRDASPLFDEFIDRVQNEL